MNGTRQLGENPSREQHDHLVSRNSGHLEGSMGRRAMSMAGRSRRGVRGGLRPVRLPAIGATSAIGIPSFKRANNPPLDGAIGGASHGSAAMLGSGRASPLGAPSSIAQPGVLKGGGGGGVRVGARASRRGSVMRVESGSRSESGSGSEETGVVRGVQEGRGSPLNKHESGTSRQGVADPMKEASGLSRQYGGAAQSMEAQQQQGEDKDGCSVS